LTNTASKDKSEAHASAAAVQPEPNMPEKDGVVDMEEVDDKEIEAQWQLLKEIEEQCLSHGRHPAEWDNIQLSWVDPVCFRSEYVLYQLFSVCIVF
jgi:hypothetical protein